MSSGIATRVMSGRIMARLFYANVESELRAKMVVAKSLLSRPWKVIGLISARLTLEVDEGNLPPNSIVFAA